MSWIVQPRISLSGVFKTALALAAFATLLSSFSMAVSAQDDAGTADSTDQPFGVLDTQPAEIDRSALETDPQSLGASTIYEIVSEESKARYLVEEELANIGANTAVGETNAIIGQLLFDDQNTPLPCSTFYVDIRTLVSDEARRDNYLRGNTLQSDQFPLATFVVTSVEDFSVPENDGEETTFVLVGNFTLHGVTQPVAWEVTAKTDGDTITGSANTEFEMPDFNIQPPVVGSVISLDETVRLEVDLTAGKAS
jgi:polyisoprenoid-binding protein YceI